jgi:hypothetical protein
MTSPSIAYRYRESQHFQPKALSSFEYKHENSIYPSGFFNMPSSTPLQIEKTSRNDPSQKEFLALTTT